MTVRFALILSAFSFFGALLFALCLSAEAQQGKKAPRIGYRLGGCANNVGTRVKAFRQGLRDFGYIEGKNILVEYRYAEGKLDQVPGLVADLVRLNVDVLVLQTLQAIRAAMQATRTIPIVMLIAERSG